MQIIADLNLDTCITIPHGTAFLPRPSPAFIGFRRDKSATLSQSRGRGAVTLAETFAKG